MLTDGEKRILLQNRLFAELPAERLDGLLRADGQWLYYGVEEENFFLIQWYPDKASAEAKLAELEALGDGRQYLVDLSLTRENPSAAENFGSSNPVQLRS